MKVLISTTSYGRYDKTPIRMLEDKGLLIETNPYGRKLTREEVVELARDAVGIIAGTETLDATVLEKLTYLKVISRCGVGLDNIDLDTAKRLGIKVFNTPDTPTLAVAELTVGLILNLLRKVNQMDAYLKNGKWEKLMGNLLSGKKVGIIGFGRIGKKVAELLKPFGSEVRYYDIRGKRLRIKRVRVKRVELEELLKTSNIVSIHISSPEQVIGKRELGLMKKGTWLINTSRGKVVDENALYLALKNGHLAGAALDVFGQEPYTGPLKELDNVILTPHIGSYAKESRIEMEKQAVENLIKGLGD